MSLRDTQVQTRFTIEQLKELDTLTWTKITTFYFSNNEKCLLSGYGLNVAFGYLNGEHGEYYSNDEAVCFVPSWAYNDVRTIIVMDILEHLDPMALYPVPDFS